MKNEAATSSSPRPRAPRFSGRRGVEVGQEEADGPQDDDRPTTVDDDRYGHQQGQGQYQCQDRLSRPFADLSLVEYVPVPVHSLVVQLLDGRLTLRGHEIETGGVRAALVVEVIVAQIGEDGEEEYVQRYQDGQEPFVADRERESRPGHRGHHEWKGVADPQ